MPSKGNNPYSTAIASSRIDYDGDALQPAEQMRKYKTEEKNAKAPTTLPYEFGEIPQYVANMIDNGFNCSKQLDVVLKMEKYADKKELVAFKNNIEKMITYLGKNADKILGKNTIGNQDSKYSID